MYAPRLSVNRKDRSPHRSTMLLYTDIITGDEVVSDAFPLWVYLP